MPLLTQNAKRHTRRAMANANACYMVLVATCLFVVATAEKSSASPLTVLAADSTTPFVSTNSSENSCDSGSGKKSTKFNKSIDFCKKWQQMWDAKYHHSGHSDDDHSEHYRDLNESTKAPHILYGTELPSRHIISLGFFPVLLIAVFLGAVVHYFDIALPQGCYRLPFTVTMGIVGVIIAFVWWISREIDYPESDFLAPMHYVDAMFHESRMSVCEWLKLPPDGIMFVLLPPLLFESCFSIKWHTFSRVLPASALLAGPGVLIAITLTAVLVQLVNTFLLPIDWCWNGTGWLYSFMLASMLSATDPVAVVGVLHSLGAPDKLAVLIEGESLLNDGSCMVIFTLFKELIEVANRSLILDLVILVVLAPILGLAMGYLLIVIMKELEEPLLECSLIIIAVYSLFYIAEHVCGTSGILSEVAFGIYVARLAVCIEMQDLSSMYITAYFTILVLDVGFIIKCTNVLRFKRDCLSETALTMNKSIWFVNFHHYDRRSYMHAPHIHISIYILYSSNKIDLKIMTLFAFTALHNSTIPTYSRSVLGFFSNTVIFVLAGLRVASSLIDLWYNKTDDHELFLRLAVSLVLIYIVLHIIRSGVVFALWVRECSGETCI